MFNPENPPEFATTRWFNAEKPQTRADLRGRVVVMLAFQMLCPGSVSRALPQVKRLFERFHAEQVAVIGLHTVFENHAQMTAEALESFIAEQEWTFPIAIDAPDAKQEPKTMVAYELRGTPTILLFDRQGRLRRHYFGLVDDIRLAAEIMAMAVEAPNAPRETSVAIERLLASVLIDPSSQTQPHDHAHVHDESCGHGHDHAHDHAEEAPPPVADNGGKKRKSSARKAKS